MKKLAHPKGYILQPLPSGFLDWDKCKSANLFFASLANDIALRQKGEMGTFDAIIRALPEPTLVVSNTFIVESSNESMNVLLEADPVGSHLTSYFRAPAVMQAAKDALVNDAKNNVEFITRGQSSRTFDVFVSAFRDAAAQKVLLIVRDLTYQQQIERMRSDFIANASHEMRTPLATLTGFIETMQGAAKQDPAAREKFLALMKTQTDRMSRLTDDLLSLSRIEINEHLRPTGEVQVSALLHQCANLLSRSALASKCTINIEVDEGLKVIGDADQLMQVFQNLLENALKYGVQGKRIEVTANQSSSWTSVIFRDYGAGIAAHHIPRLTERFYRVDVQESRTRGGTGLGLAIVKHILNRHRGKLVIESELGQGSRFTVRLPAS